MDRAVDVHVKVFVFFVMEDAELAVDPSDIRQPNPDVNHDPT